MGKIRHIELSAVRVNVLEGVHTRKFARPRPFKQRTTDTKVSQDGDLPQEGIGSETGYKERTGNDFTRGGKHFLRKGRGVERLAANRRVVLKTISEMDELKAPGDLDKDSAVPQKVF